MKSFLQHSEPEGDAELPDDGLPEDFHDWEEDDDDEED